MVEFLVVAAIQHVIIAVQGGRFGARHAFLLSIWNLFNITFSTMNVRKNDRNLLTPSPSPVWFSCRFGFYRVFPITISGRLSTMTITRVPTWTLFVLTFWRNTRRYAHLNREKDSSLCEGKTFVVSALGSGKSLEFLIVVVRKPTLTSRKHRRGRGERARE